MVCISMMLYISASTRIFVGIHFIHCASGAQLGAEQKGGRQQVWGPRLSGAL